MNNQWLIIIGGIMKYKRELIIILIITILVLSLKFLNVLQMENNLGYPLSLLLIIIICSTITIWYQRAIDKNHNNKDINYKNLDILKYVSAILIIVLHLRPFQNFSNELDLLFNNIITRICVPIFFLITGYFVAIKERDNPNYIKDYIKKMIPLYLVWSTIYLPIVIGVVINNISLINEYLSLINLKGYVLVMLLILCLPIILLVMLLYTGVYYHLWYFPALLLSLLVLYFWKKKFKIKSLLIISFVLLLFGATETYYGVLPINIKEIVTSYYKIFFTTRNFLFFGLFYVVLGFHLGSKKEVYSSNCFIKLIVSIFFLVWEAIFLHDTERLNSNILLSCVPLVYYLFISVLYITKNNKRKGLFPFRDLSKYYYFLHPFVILICLSILKLINVNANPYIQILIVLLLTHILSMLIINIKKKNPKLII